MRFYAETPNNALRYFDGVPRQGRIGNSFRKHINFSLNVYETPEKNSIAFTVCSRRDERKRRDFWEQRGGYPNHDVIIESTPPVVTLQEDGVVRWRMMEIAMRIFSAYKKISGDIYLNDEFICRIS